MLKRMHRQWEDEEGKGWAVPERLARGSRQTQPGGRWGSRSLEGRRLRWVEMGWWLAAIPHGSLVALTVGGMR